MSTQYLTEEGAQKLRDELEHLKGTVREDLAKRLKAAIEMGDLSENADYIATKEEQGFIEGRIQELEHLLRHATIIENKEDGYDVVKLGAKITIQEKDFSPEKYYIVGSREANPSNGRISNESPIGKALMGKKVGDQVTVKTPNGSLELKILAIE